MSESKRRLIDLNKEIERLTRKIKRIEKNLAEEETRPTQSLSILTSKRQKSLKTYNEVVKTKNKIEIQKAQNILFDAIYMESIASLVENLRTLTEQRRELMDEKILLETRLLSQKPKKQSDQYWVFDF